MLTDSFLVELLFRPSIPDNIENWRVFDNDEKLIDFSDFEGYF